MLHLVVLSAALAITGSGPGGDGSRDRPFDGTGIKLGIASEAPFWRVDSWNFTRRGDFCEDAPPLFQLVGAEGREPTLVFPRVRSDLARFDVRTRVDGRLVQRTFWVAPHPAGCRRIDTPGPLTILEPSTTSERSDCAKAESRLEAIKRALRELLRGLDD